MWPATVRPELLPSPGTMELLEITFSDLCGCRSWGWTPQNSSTRCAGHCGEGSSGTCTLPDWDGLPRAAAKHSRAAVQHEGEACTTQGEANTGNNATVSKLPSWCSRCLAPVSFLPWVGHFCPQCGELKYCPPNVLNVLSVPWGMRCCKPGWAARASQKGGSWQQAALPNVFSQPLIKLWDSFYSCAVLEKLEACMDLHDGRICPWVYRRGKLLAFLYKEYDQRQLATYFWYSPLQFLRWHLRAPTSI